MGTIILPKNVDAEQRAIHEQGVINMVLVASIWLIMVGILVVYFKREEIRQRPKGASIDEALDKKICQTIEFKEGQPDKALAFAVCAFANTNSEPFFWESMMTQRLWA